MERTRLKATSIWHTNRTKSIPFFKWNLIFCQPPQKNDAKWSTFVKLILQFIGAYVEPSMLIITELLEAGSL